MLFERIIQIAKSNFSKWSTKKKKKKTEEEKQQHEQQHRKVSLFLTSKGDTNQMFSMSKYGLKTIFFVQFNWKRKIIIKKHLPKHEYETFNKFIQIG